MVKKKGYREKNLIKKTKQEKIKKWLVDGIENVKLMISKKTLSKYLQIINDNVKIKKDVNTDQKIWYNLFTSQAVLFPTRASPPLPFDNQPIERMSEILVSIPHLTPNYFVLCTP